MEKGRLRRIFLATELERNSSRFVAQPKLYPGANRKIENTGMIAAVAIISRNV
jgi:hypothetical protein